MTDSVREKLTPDASSQELRRNVLGVGAITFFVVSAAGPLVAIAGGFPLAMMLGNGAGLPAALCLVVLVLLCFAAGYTAMAKHITNAGGFYAFIANGFGGAAGGAAALVALLSYNCMQIGIYGMFGAATSGLLKDTMHLDLPWWLYVGLAMASVAILGYRQVDLSVKVLSGLVVAEYLGILVLDIFILKSGGATGIDATSFTPGSFFSGSTSIGLLFCFAAFIGFEATTIYGEEAKDPERTIPLATYFSVLLIGCFYAFSSWCMVVGAGPEKLVPAISALQDPTTFLFTLSDQYVGPWLTLILRILFVTSVYAGLLAFHNATARYFFAMGREGLLPAVLGRTHSRFKSPNAGSVLQTILALVVVAGFALGGLDPVLALFSWLTNLGTLGIILLMAVASFSVPAFFASHPDPELSALRKSAMPLLAGVALAAIVVLAVIHFDVLTGASPTLSIVLPALVLVAAVIGVLLALGLRGRSPQRFAQIGRNRAV